MAKEKPPDHSRETTLVHPFFYSNHLEISFFVQNNNYPVWRGVDWGSAMAHSLWERYFRELIGSLQKSPLGELPEAFIVCEAFALSNRFRSIAIIR